MICIVNKPQDWRAGGKEKVILNVLIHNCIRISNSPNVHPTVWLSFCLTHHYHHYCYRRAKIKGWCGLIPLSGSIEERNLDKPWAARTGLFAYSGLGPGPRFQATTLLRKFQRCQVTMFPFCFRNQAKSSVRLGGKYRLVPSNPSSLVLTH